MIRVCFYVDFETDLARSLVNKMLESPYFQVNILVIPYFTKGQADFDSLFENYNKLHDEFGEIVLCSYCNGDFVEFNGFDFVCKNSLYENATHKYYTIQHIAQQKMKPFFIIYGYIVSNWYEHIYQSFDFSLLWKYFAESEFSRMEILNKTNINQEKLILSGYAKMDRLHDIIPKNRKRKCIILAFHHTIFDKGVYFSNFLEYADFFQEIPKMYSEIDFVFRPHPLLLENLCRDDVWGKDKTAQYFLNIDSMPNAVYQKGGDYFETFVNSDALIHDCGSFMVEYLYTDHPACYILKDSKTNKNNYNAFARECIAKHYQAFNQIDILNFIEKIVIKGEDTMKEERLTFSKTLMINYPNVCEFICDYIQKDFEGNYCRIH